MTQEAPRAGAEAAQLFVAAQEWLRASAPHLAPVAADGETCPCPVCRGIAKVRDTDPDSVARWVDGAVTALETVIGQAAAGLAQAAGGPSASPADNGDPATDDQPADDGTAQTGHDAPRTRRVRRIPILDDASSSGSTTEPGQATPLSGG